MKIRGISTKELLKRWSKLVKKDQQEHSYTGYIKIYNKVYYVKNLRPAGFNFIEEDNEN